MQKDPYLILGLTKGASEEQVTARYNELKEKYSNDRFLEGEVGMEAAKKLSELEIAYKDCLEDISLSKAGGAMDGVEAAIRKGNYDDAQRLLDDIDMRDAEWHYYQAMVYFKKGWHNESKAQLDICIALEPYNEKYTTARNKMDAYIKNNGSSANANNAAKQQQQQQQQSQQRAGYSDRQTNAETNANACCDSCCTLMCCDSCCECMGGDLIPCC